MILDSARRVRIGSLVIVRALGRNGAIADWLIPVAHHLRVVIADAEDPLLRGKRFMVRPIYGSPRHHRDRERQRSELVPLEAYGMRIAEVGRYPATGVAFLKVERDPALEPELDANGKPFLWGNPYNLTGWLDYLDYTTAVDDRAMRWIRLDEETAKGLAA